jgi:hypothetical protein
MHRDGSRIRDSYQEVQEDEAVLVANSIGLRCTGALAIARRSPVWRIARSGRGCYWCSGAPLTKGRRQGDALCQGRGGGVEDRSGGGRGLPETSGALRYSGGLATSSLRSLAVSFARVWEGRTSMDGGVK